jgi:hypothetical protein
MKSAFEMQEVEQRNANVYFLPPPIDGLKLWGQIQFQQLSLKISIRLLLLGRCAAAASFFPHRSRYPISIPYPSSRKRVGLEVTISSCQGILVPSDLPTTPREKEKTGMDSRPRLDLHRHLIAVGNNTDWKKTTVKDIQSKAVRYANRNRYFICSTDLTQSAGLR